MSSLDQRKDIRTVEVFADNLEDFTEREMLWGIALRYDFTERGNPCSIEECGVDNTGKLIEGRLPNYNVDKIFKFLDGKQVQIEIKTIGEYVKNFFTFKAHSLRNCFEKNAFLIVPRSNSYYIFSPSACKLLYENYPHKVWDNFWKGGLSVRIFSNEIENLISNKIIKKRDWTNKAKSFIKHNYSELFREKRT